jgi:hypothetical protein
MTERCGIAEAVFCVFEPVLKAMRVVEKSLAQRDGASRAICQQASMRNSETSKRAVYGIQMLIDLLVTGVLPSVFVAVKVSGYGPAPFHFQFVRSTSTSLCG